MSSMVVDRGCQLEAKFIGSGRCLPVARGRAGSEGHVWPWNPTSPRRRAFHSNVPPLPLSLSLSLSLSFSSPSLSLRLPTYPAPTCSVSFALLFSLLAPRQLAPTLRPPASVFELAFFLRVAIAFREFHRVYRDDLRPTSRATLRNLPKGKFPETEIYGDLFW